MSEESQGDRGLIFSLIRVGSSTFIGIEIDVAMQVTDVGIIWRTLIQTSKKIGRSTVRSGPLATI
jgi:hypothetical protein